MRRGSFEIFDSEDLSDALEFVRSRDASEMPVGVRKTLLHVIDALQHGVAVASEQQNRMVTTQQAAELLNVSRPTVVKLLDAAKIPFGMAGSHRRLRLADVLAYRDVRRKEQYDTLAALYSLGADDQADLAQALLDLRDARKAVVKRRALEQQE